MLVVTFPWRAVAIVVVAAAASAPPPAPASFDPPLELPEELPDPLEPPELEPLELPELPEPLELPEGAPESGCGVDGELLLQAKRSEEESDAIARDVNARE